MSPETLLVLMAHGSRDPRWRQPFEQLLADLEHPACMLCYMEMAEPTLLQAVAAYPQVKTVVIWPLFWSAGSHVRTDVQEQAQALQRERPHCQVKVLPPMGEHPAIQTLVRQLIQQQLDTVMVLQPGASTHD